MASRRYLGHQNSHRNSFFREVIFQGSHRSRSSKHSSIWIARDHLKQITRIFSQCLFSLTKCLYCPCKWNRQEQVKEREIERERRKIARRRYTDVCTFGFRVLERIRAVLQKTNSSVERKPARKIIEHCGNVTCGRVYTYGNAIDSFSHFVSFSISSLCSCRALTTSEEFLTDCVHKSR